MYLGTTNANPLYLWTQGTPRVTVAPSGNVGIGTTGPGYPLDVNGTVRAVDYVSTSDVRLKKDITPIEGLELVTKLQGVRYRWKKDNVADFGLIAQDVEKVIPDAVVTDHDGFKAVKYANLISPVIEAIKELFAKWQGDSADLHRELASVKARADQADTDNAALRDNNARLLKQMDDLRARMDALEKKSRVASP